MTFKPEGFTASAVVAAAQAPYKVGSKVHQVAGETAEIGFSYACQLPESAWTGDGWTGERPPKAVLDKAVANYREEKRQKVGFIVETFIWMLFYAIIIKILVEILWWMWSTPGARSS
jgi:hypothetical protein